jgi:hypothetical protein
MKQYEFPAKCNHLIHEYLSMMIIWVSNTLSRIRPMCVMRSTDLVSFTKSHSKLVTLLRIKSVQFNKNMIRLMLHRNYMTRWSSVLIHGLYRIMYSTRSGVVEMLRNSHSPRREDHLIILSLRSASPEPDIVLLSFGCEWLYRDRISLSSCPNAPNTHWRLFQTAPIQAHCEMFSDQAMISKFCQFGNIVVRCPRQAPSASQSRSMASISSTSAAWSESWSRFVRTATRERVTHSEPAAFRFSGTFGLIIIEKPFEYQNPLFPQLAMLFLNVGLWGHPR